MLRKWVWQPEHDGLVLIGRGSQPLVTAGPNGEVGMGGCITKRATLVRRSRFAHLCSACLLVVAVATSASADQTIGAGGVVSLCDGSVDYCCTDLFIAGTLNLDEGTLLNVRNLTVLAGGVLNGGSGSYSVAGDFTVQPGGQFNPEESTALPGNLTCADPAPAPAPAMGVAGLMALLTVLLGLAARRFRLETALRREHTKGASS